MLINKVKIHDKFSFEIKLNYNLDNLNKTALYKINTFIFIPESLDINRNTYEKQDFYNSLKTYIRLKTPVYLMRNIVSENDSPYSKLKQSFVNVINQFSEKSLENYEYYIRMFCSISKSSIRDSVTHIRKSDIDDRNMFLIKNFISEVSMIVKKYRNLENIINVSTLSHKNFLIYKFGDEYLSNIVEIYLYKFLEIIRKKKLDNFLEIKHEILNLIKEDIAYRKEKGYVTIPNENSNNEELLYRRSILKKYIDNKLFLNTRYSKEGNIAEQLVFSIAAGFAMVFATMIAFISKIKFGDLSTQFFFILIVSYMLKDRIKELSRMYFNIKIRNMFFDHKTKIYNDKKKVIGISKESLDFIKESKISSEIKTIRNKNNSTEIENESVKENILLYRKHVEILPKKLRKAYHNFDFGGINDISRFNIEKFLQKMDNPYKKLFVTQNDEFIKIKGNRVYHLNMVIQYVMSNEVFYKRFRIVLNRSGIKRIEKVSF